MDQLKHLGKPSNQPIDQVDLIEWTGRRITVRLDCAEFTCLCPVTGQPDFATLVIEYAPDEHIAETKSVKLYLWRYRAQPAFNEQVIDTIAGELFSQIKPLWLRVVGRFNARGGISPTVTAERGDTKHRPC